MLLSPPRDNLFRSSTFELRAPEGKPSTLTVNFARFNEWTEINSIFEGRFMERFAPGAFKKTFAEQRDQIRAIFQHGQDPVAGLKPLGPVRDLYEAEAGAYGVAELLDAEYVREIEVGLRENLYGASFQFRAVREEVVQDPGTSDHNPQGIPERTVTEAMVREFGPVTWGAYPNASSSVRSLTDELLGERDPARLRELADRIEARDAAAVEEDTPSSEEERAPADEATPAATLARVAWLRKQRAEDGAPGALSTPR